MGGVDSKGSHVVYCHAGGNHAYLPYVAMGSGSLNCIAVLESKYRDGMNVKLSENNLNTFLGWRSKSLINGRYWSRYHAWYG